MELCLFAILIIPHDFSRYGYLQEHAQTHQLINYFRNEKKNPKYQMFARMQVNRP